MRAFLADVGTTLVLQYDDERAEISCTHFVIERFLDSGISDEDEVADCEVVEEGTTLEWGETPQDGGGPLTRSVSCD